MLWFFLYHFGGSFGKTSTLFPWCPPRPGYSLPCLPHSSLICLPVARNHSKLPIEDTLSWLPMLLRFYSLKTTTEKSFKGTLRRKGWYSVCVPFLMTPRGCFIIKHFHNHLTTVPVICWHHFLGKKYIAWLQVRGGPNKYVSQALDTVTWSECQLSRTRAGKLRFASHM